jgi:hypothetical protein
VRFEQTIIIIRAPQVVFAYRCALENSPKWQRGVITATRATEGPIEVGTQWIEQRRGPGGVVEDWELEVTAYQIDRLLGITARCGSTQVEERHLLDDEGGATRYTLSVDVTGSSTPISLVQKQAIDGLLHLKWALEARARTA